MRLDGIGNCPPILSAIQYRHQRQPRCRLRTADVPKNDLDEIPGITSYYH